MARFKSIDYSKIVDDEFITEAKELLEVTKSKVSGSYLRYGKDKACDLDLSEELDIDETEIPDLLNSYFKKLKERKNDFILTRLSFDIIDDSIKRLIDNLGNLNGLLQIENSNISEDQINKLLPKKMVNEIKTLIKEYNDDKTILTYVNLYMYLKKNIQPIFTLEEAIKGEKKFNGEKIKISDYNFTYMYIEVIFENYRVSNFVYLRKQNKPETKLWNVELNEVLIESLIENSKNKYQMSYYKLLKYFFHFLKKGYFNKIFEERDLIDQTIDTYNEIYDFREKVGNMHNNLCKIENMILIDKKNKKLHEDYKNLKQEFELKCKNYFLQVSKRYSKYLREYFKLI
jgi:hypothetical protein